MRSIPRWVVSLALLLAVLVAAMPLITIAQSSGNPQLGDAQAYVGPEGNVLALLAVDEITDPFSAYPPDYPPDRGFHFVQARLTVQNAGTQPFTFDYSKVLLLDVDGFLYSYKSITRSEESQQADPDFPYGAIAPGESVQGAVFFSVPNGVRLRQVIYTPASNRLLTLADLGGVQGMPQGQAEPAPTAPTTASTASTALYQNSDYGFQLTYDPAVWQVDAESGDGISLYDGRSYVSLTGSNRLPTDAAACVDAIVQSVSQTSSRQNYQPAVDTNGNTVGASSPWAAFNVYTYLNRDGTQLFERIECRTLTQNRGVVTITQNGQVADYVTESTAFETLMIGLSLG